MKSITNTAPVQPADVAYYGTPADPMMSDGKLWSASRVDVTYRDLEDAARETAATLTQAQRTVLADRVRHYTPTPDPLDALVDPTHTQRFPASANINLGYHVRCTTQAKLLEAGCIVNDFRYTESERAALATLRDRCIVAATNLLNLAATTGHAHWPEAFESLKQAKDAQANIDRKEYILTPLGVAVGKLGVK